MAAIVALTIVLPAGAVGAQQAPSDLESRALGVVAQREGVPRERLRVINSAELRYPEQGRSAFDFKVEDAGTTAMYGVTLSRDGQPADVARLDEAERAAYAAKYGKLEPELADRVGRAGANERIPVIIWVKAPSDGGPQRPDSRGAQAPRSKAEVQAIEAQARSRATTAATTAAGPVIARLGGLGHRATAARYVPVVYADLPAAAIQQVSGWAEVDRIYLPRTYRPALQEVRPTVGADAVNGRGITGAGVQLAQVEVGGRVEKQNPYLGRVTQDETVADPATGRTYVCPDVSPHSTSVAGIMVSSHDTARGIAPDANLWATGACPNVPSTTQDLENRAKAAVAHANASAINLSYYVDTNRVPVEHDRFMDALAFNTYTSMIASAGTSAQRILIARAATGT